MNFDILLFIILSIIYLYLLSTVYNKTKSFQGLKGSIALFIVELIARLEGLPPLYFSLDGLAESLGRNAILIIALIIVNNKNKKL